MVSAYRAQFDFIVLKPVWFSLVGGAGVSFYQGAWAVGAVCVVMMFAAGRVGAKLHRTLSFEELAAGIPGFADAERPLNPADVSHADSRAVTSACFSVALIVGILSAVIALREHGWLFSTLLGVAVWGVGAVFAVILFALIARLYMLGRLRSITPGMLLFWLGVGAPVTLVTLVVRVAM